MNGTDFFSEIALINYTIPAWQMILYIIIISFCMLMSQQRKLPLMTTYLFTFYWGFNLYWGQTLASAGEVPASAKLYLLFGIAHVVLTLVAFFQKE